jgi:uncharacterized phage protein (TIGR01671 family)
MTDVQKMRERKFRAWDGQHLIYFDLSDIITCGEMGSERRVQDSKGNTIVLWVQGIWNPEVVIEQSTGLKDKSGVAMDADTRKEIYGGDVVRFTFDCDIETHILTGWIEWNNDGYWQVAIIDESFSTALFDSRLHEIEVIGNVHENLELLTVNRSLY